MTTSEKYEKPRLVAVLNVLGAIQLITGIGLLIWAVNGSRKLLVVWAISLVCLSGFLFAAAVGLDLLAKALFELKGIRAQPEEQMISVTPPPASHPPKEYSYYYTDKGEIYGPMLLSEIAATMPGDTSVQRDGSDNWLPLSTLLTA